MSVPRPSALGAIVMLDPSDARGFVEAHEMEIEACLDPAATTAQSAEETELIRGIARGARRTLATQCFLRGVVFVVVHGGDYFAEVRVDEGLSDDERSRRFVEQSAHVVVADAGVVLCAPDDLGRTAAQVPTIPIAPGKYRVGVHGLSVEPEVVGVFGTPAQPAIVFTLSLGELTEPPEELPTVSFGESPAPGLSAGKIVRAHVKRINPDGIAILELHRLPNVVSGYAQTRIPERESIAIGQETWVKLLGLVPGVKGRWLAERVPPPA